MKNRDAEAQIQTDCFINIAVTDFNCYRIILKSTKQWSKLIQLKMINSVVDKEVSGRSL